MRYVIVRTESAVQRWRWKLQAGNGRSIAVSGESYFNRRDALRAIEKVKASIAAPVVDRAAEEN